MPLPDDVLQQLADLDQRVENLEKFPQPPTVIESNESSVEFFIGGSSSGDNQVLLATILHNVYDLKLLAVPRMTLFLVRQIGDPPLNAYYRYPFQSAEGWTAFQVENLHITQWIAPYDDDQQHPDDLVLYSLFINTMSVGYLLHAAYDWRIMSMEGG